LKKGFVKRKMQQKGMPSESNLKRDRRERVLYSLRKVSDLIGMPFEHLSRQIKGRRYSESALAEGLDIAVSEVQLRLMPSLNGLSFEEVFDQCGWDTVVEEREVSVFQKPPNTRLLFCVDKEAKRYHVWVGNSRPFVKGMRLMIAPHPSSTLRGFWHVIGPVPRYPGDKSFKPRWNAWRKACR
jgi:hypothetical protein